MAGVEHPRTRRGLPPRTLAAGGPEGEEARREITARGYPGAYQNVAHYVAAVRKQVGSGAAALPTTTRLTAPRAVGLALVRPARSDAPERQTVQQVKAAHPSLHTAVTLLERFARLIRRQTDQPTVQELVQ